MSQEQQDQLPLQEVATEAQEPASAKNEVTQDASTPEMSAKEGRLMLFGLWP
ncbi:MAG: hypothetical protein NVS9B9_03700 [Ktedonobacteraceae bacterium]